MSKLIRRLAVLTTVAVVVAGVALLVVSVGPLSTGASSGAGGQGVESVEPLVHTVASASGRSLTVFEQPDGGDVMHRLANPRPSGAPLVLLVVDERPGWFQVQLAERPNGSTGWIRQADVTTDRHSFRIEISLGTHRLSAFDGDRRILETKAAVGQPGTPTPTGDFYTTELLRPTNPRGVYGPYAFGLSAHSDVLTDFAGGDGTVGIHGTNDPSALGTDASHGCIRISNEAITTLAETLPLGTPVKIVT